MTAVDHPEKVIGIFKKNFNKFFNIPTSFFYSLVTDTETRENIMMVLSSGSLLQFLL